MKPTKILLLFFLLTIAYQSKAQDNYLNFDGNNDYIQIEDDSIFDFSGDFTLEFKVKKDALNTRGDIFTKKDNVSSAPGINYLGLFINTDNKFHFYLRKLGNDPIIDISSATSVSTSIWTHVACVRSGNNLSLYVNGTLEATGTHSDDLTSNGPIRIGSNRAESLNPNSSPTQLYDGNIDEARIWNIARTSTEILNNYNNELVGNETGLIAYYDFNQGDPCTDNTIITTLNDKTSNGNNGTLKNFSLQASATNPCTSNWNGDNPSSLSNTNVISEIKLYPNPTNSSITIETGEANLIEISILDINGSLITIMDKETKKIDLSTFSSGVYFIKIATKEGTDFKKVIKK